MNQAGHKLIVFEGVNKSGKSALVKNTADWMTSRGLAVETIREPGGTPVGEQIREILLSNVNRPPATDVLLFNAARAALVQKIGQLLLGSHVVADRSYLSTIAFQVHGDGAPATSTRDICRFALGNSYHPDAFFLLDISYQDYLARLKADDPPDYFERDETHFERVRTGFISEAKRIGAFIIDASQSPDMVQSGIKAILEEIL